jgi:3D (Asp-Asp-Asp) domain-containing protein
VIPAAVVAVGMAASAGIVITLKATKTHLPAMAAVDEVSLALPAISANAPTGRRISSDWPEPEAPSMGRIRGNVIGGDLADTTVPDSSDVVAAEAESVADVIVDENSAYASDPNVRWFNARPARPARTIWMTVTGYSPDERSCGDSADGLTATMHSVTTNAMKLVAADPTVLPYGSMVSVPGYDTESIVPVLDCGGAIKGDKLDLLFPTHAEAMKWGRQRVLVTVWEYVDGKPADNPRKLR